MGVIPALAQSPAALSNFTARLVTLQSEPGTAPLHTLLLITGEVWARHTITHTHTHSHTHKQTHTHTHTHIHTHTHPYRESTTTRLCVPSGCHRDKGMGFLFKGKSEVCVC